MQIEQLTLRGYKRLMLNNIHELVITPESNFQLILGTNGSGKSSLMEELSPLPANTADFTKDGEKIIKISHLGDNYILTSTFKHGSKHSFIQESLGDEGELNKGGTSSVQKELVRRIFNITPDLHELVTDRVLFTSMAPAKRREWITLLNSTDLTYAMEVFRRLQTKLRDSSGVVKHLKSRLVTETNKAATMDDTTGLDFQVDMMRDELDLVYSDYDRTVGDRPTLERSIKIALNDLERLSTALIKKTIPPVGLDTVRSLNDARVQLQQLRTDSHVQRAVLNQYTQNFADLENLLGNLRSVGADNIDELKHREAELLSALKESTGKVVRFQIDVGASEALVESEQCGSDLMTLLNTMSDNPDRVFSKDSIHLRREQMRGLIAENDRTTNNLIIRGEARIEHLKAHLENRCSQCGFLPTEAATQQELNHCLKALEKLRSSYDERIVQIQAHTEWLEKADEWMEGFFRFRKLQSSYPRLQPLWEVMVEEGVYEKPSNGNVWWKTWFRDITACVEIHRIRQELEPIQNVIRELAMRGDQRQLTTRAEELSGLIEQTMDRVKTIERELVTYETLVRIAEETEQLHCALKEHLSKVDQLSNQLTIAIRNEQYDTVIRSHQDTLAIAQRRLHEQSTQEALINDIDSQLGIVGLDQLILKTLVDELSPTDGLIAEQLVGFIECLVGQMNDIIGQVWTYDLTVKPCALESGELDYKFPIEVRSGSNVVPDIGKGSTAQKEIINFAFKVVVMLYMGLHQYPLYLDELGHSFDEQHRQNVMNYVKLLVETHKHSQVFMVSHYACSHNAFVNADVCVLDGSNIAVPQGHNQHVRIS